MHPLVVLLHCTMEQKVITYDFKTDTIMDKSYLAVEDGSRTNLQDLKWRPFETEQGDEHEDEQDSPGQLKVLLRLVLAEARDPGEEGSGFGAGFGEDEEESSDEGEIPEEELHVPENAVGHSLEKKHHQTSEGSFLDVCLHQV